MAFRQRGDREFRGDDRRPGRESQTERPNPPKSARAGLNEFFVDGKGIHREVLQKEICRFLGPEATSRPSTYKGVDGYLIKAVRPFTQEMLDDLIQLSKGYVSEREAMMRRGHRDFTYGDSETSRQQDLHMDTVDDDDEQPYPMEHDGRRFPPTTAYSSAPPQPAYATATSFAQSQGPSYAPVYTPGPMLPPGPQYPGGSTYPNQPFPAPVRPPYEANYTYGGNEYPPQGDHYNMRGPGPFMGHEDRPNLRDPHAYPNNPRMDPRDPRNDPRADARYAYMTSPGPSESSMGSMNDRYDPYGAAPPNLASGRNFTGPPRGVQPAFADRESPLRDAYGRHEPPRGDHRRR